MTREVMSICRSRNASGVWHSVRIRGNAINLRAHRERRRSQRK
jgi:hypothetical protein